MALTVNISFLRNLLNINTENEDELHYKIKSIAFEFAKLGMSGIDPKKNNYSVPSINKNMSGYQALAFYYVTWALAIPEHLAELQLPFDKEYEMAFSFNKI